MSASSWIKRIAPLVALVISIGTYLFLDQPAPAREEESPTLVFGGVTDPVDAARASEHFQIVDDAVDGDISAAADALAASSTIDASSTVQVQTNATVTKVVDGDTVDVKLDSGKDARIRMLGVNTPETVDPRRTVECFGKQASAFSKTTLDGARIRLEADPKADERDVYGRLLRNIVLEDGTDFNAKLVAEGYAYAYLNFPLDPVRKKQLSDLEQEAKAAKRGLWAPDACPE